MRKPANQSVQGSSTWKDEQVIILCDAGKCPGDGAVSRAVMRSCKREDCIFIRARKIKKGQRTLEKTISKVGSKKPTVPKVLAKKKIGI